MRKVVLGSLIAAATSLSCLAESFSLKDDATGKVYGPFEFKTDAKVLIGTNSFTIVKPDTKSGEKKITIVFEPTMEQKLAQTVIPQIDFRQANVRDVIEFLRQASEDYSPFKDAKHKSVNFVTKIDDAEDVGTITFKAQRISLRDTLNAITSVANLEYELRDNWVLIKPVPKKAKK